MKEERILVLDFGGQYNQLIARRVRECNVYCEVHPYNMTIEKIKEFNPNGIIFTGGPNSVFEEDSPHINPEVFNLGYPILGICYGCQTIGHALGGKVTHAPKSEYGKTLIEVDNNSLLFGDVSKNTNVWMSHTDYVSEAPKGFKITAKSKTCPIAAMEDTTRKIYGVQFHPEVMHSEEGMKMISNFVLKFEIRLRLQDNQFFHFVFYPI